MQYALVKLYDDPDGRSNGFGVFPYRDVLDIWDDDRDYIIYVAM